MNPIATPLTRTMTVPTVSARTLPPADPALDRAIIDAFLDEENGGLRALYSRGFSEKTVTERASRLGLTRDFIKRCRLAETRPAVRTCVKCDASFLSAGKHNRLCGRCPAR